MLRGGFGGGGRNRTGVDGFAGRCMTTLPPRPGRRTRRSRQAIKLNGRARLLSHGNWSGKGVSNSRPQPWQGCALPTELFPRKGRIISRAYPCMWKRLAKVVKHRHDGQDCGDIDQDGAHHGAIEKTEKPVVIEKHRDGDEL